MFPAGEHLLCLVLVFYPGQIVLVGHENALLIIAPGFLHQFGKKCKMTGAKTSQMTDAGQSDIVSVEQMTKRPAGKSIAGALLEKQIHPICWSKRYLKFDKLNF
jgi:hypothetical protein